jgi:lipoate synthase
VLVISIKPGQLLLMNMPCRYCQECDLIIARKRELESAVTDRLRESVPESTGTDYSVLGTLDREDWVAGSSGALGLREIKERLYAFKDVWNFDLSLSD